MVASQITLIWQYIEPCFLCAYILFMVAQISLISEYGLNQAELFALKHKGVVNI